MSAMPTIGERAIITKYGHQARATYVESCDDKDHGRNPHWCYDEPTPNGGTWNSGRDVTREPIPAPRAWQPSILDDPGVLLDRPSRVALHLLDHRIRSEAWRVNPSHRAPGGRIEYMRRVKRHLADAVRALEET